MSCFSKCSVVLALIAVAIATGVLPIAIVKIGKLIDFEMATGSAPIFQTAEEREAAQFEQIPKGALNGKTCLVTGANVGLGLATAEELALKGCNVVAAGRRETALKEACTQLEAAVERANAKGSCVPMVVDLADLSSVRAFTKAFLDQQDKLDVVVLNAGVGEYSPKVNAHGIDSVFAINHLGHFALVQDLEKLILQTGKETGDARIVVVSSGMHMVWHPDEGICLTKNCLANLDEHKCYSHSKLANVLYAQKLAKRLPSDQVLVNSCHPGVVNTNIYEPVFAALKAREKQHPAFAPVFRGLSWLFERFIASVSFTPKDGARTQVWLAASPSVKEQRVTGKYFHPHMVEVNVSSTASRVIDGVLIEDGLWSFTESLLVEIEA